MTKARDLASGGFGLVLIKPSSVVNGTDNGKGTVSFSAASTVSLNDVFSTNYTNYKIVHSFTSTANGDLAFRFRVSNADNTTSSYKRGRMYVGSVDSLAFGSDNQTVTSGFFFNAAKTGSNNLTTAEVSNPFATQTTPIQIETSGRFFISSAGQFDGATSFTGFTVYCDGAFTMTGEISVYGYNK